MSLINHLNAISDASKIQLIGQKICDSLSNYKQLMKEHSNQQEMLSGTDYYSELLLQRFGANILIDKKNRVFETLIRFLDDDLKNQIKVRFGLNTKNSHEFVRIIVSKFGYKDLAFTRDLMELLEIEPIYLPVENQAVDLLPATQDLIPTYNLHEFQKTIKDKVIRLIFRLQIKQLLIHLPTGAGKTKTCVEIICDFIRNYSIIGGLQNTVNVVWIAHSNELCDQAIETFKNTWQLRGDFKIAIHRIYSEYQVPDINSVDPSISNIFFIGFPKIVSIKRGIRRNEAYAWVYSYLKENINLSIIDEAHKSVASQWFDSVQHIVLGHGKTLIGLTATPARTSGVTNIDNVILRELYGGNIIKLMQNDFSELDNPIGFLQEKGYLAEIEEIPILTHVDISLFDNEIDRIRTSGRQGLDRILSDLTENPIRNALIVESIREEYRLGNQILIFACSVEHCYILKSILRTYEIESEIIEANTPKNIRDQIVDEFKNETVKVLFNYEVLSTGFDHPRLKSLMIARPTTSIVLYSQMLGRLIRGEKNGGFRHKRLITVIDNLAIGNQNEIFVHFSDIWETNRLT